MAPDQRRRAARLDHHAPGERLLARTYPFTLTWWSSQLKQQARPAVLEVVIQAAPDSGAPTRSLKVVLRSGVRVAVPLGFDELTLSRLLTVLEGR